MSEDEIIAIDEVNGLAVSTVFTVDMGPETAIVDMNGAHPVERYASRALAEDGHNAWVLIAEDAEVVWELGLDKKKREVKLARYDLPGTIE